MAGRRGALRACDLWKNAMQTVFGEGRRGAKAVFVDGGHHVRGDRRRDQRAALLGDAPDDTARRREMSLFVADLRAVAEVIRRLE